MAQCTFCQTTLADSVPVCAACCPPEIAEAVQAGDFDQAINRCQQRILEDPGNAALHALLGDLHRANGQLDHAHACYQRAHALNPRFAVAPIPPSTVPLPTITREGAPPPAAKRAAPVNAPVVAAAPPALPVSFAEQRTALDTYAREHTVTVVWAAIALIVIFLVLGLQPWKQPPHLPHYALPVTGTHTR